MRTATYTLPSKTQAHTTNSRMQVLKSNTSMLSVMYRFAAQDGEFPRHPNRSPTDLGQESLHSGPGSRPPSCARDHTPPPVSASTACSPNGSSSSQATARYPSRGTLPVQASPAASLASWATQPKSPSYACAPTGQSRRRRGLGIPTLLMR